MIRHIVLRSFLMLTALVISGCSLTVDTDVTEEAVAQFHKDYNATKFREIYSSANPDFQNFVKEDKFVRLLKKLHNSLGQHKSSHLISLTSESTLRKGAIVTLIYSAVYDNDDTAKESFTFKVVDGFAKLYNFNVSSEILSKPTNI